MARFRLAASALFLHPLAWRRAERLTLNASTTNRTPRITRVTAIQRVYPATAGATLGARPDATSRLIRSPLELNQLTVAGGRDQRNRARELNGIWVA